MDSYSNTTQDPILQAWQGEMDAAKEKPWIAALLLNGRRDVFGRFVQLYHRLAALPRRMRRQIKRQTALTLAGAAFMMALGRAPIVQTAPAATIPVTPGAAGFNGGDGCSIIEAITNANDDAATHAECVAGSGADIITLAGNTYSYTAAFGTDTALPDITSSITIEAAGSTLERVVGSPEFRILNVAGANANVTLNSATITGGNFSGGGGGGVSVNNNATVAIINSTLNGNSAYYGGGLHVDSSIANITNSTISDNTTAYGGGIFVSTNATTTIMNSTFSGNTGTTRGGGIYVGSQGSVASIRSIISGNSSPAGAEMYQSNGSLSSDTSIIGHNGLTNSAAISGLTSSIDDITATSDGTDPTALASILTTILTDNDGPSKTHALVSGSPAIDVVAIPFRAGCTAGELDQRGAPRADGLNAGGAACDLGAFEYASDLKPTAVTMEALSAASGGAWLPATLGGLLASATAWRLGRKEG